MGVEVSGVERYGVGLGVGVLGLEGSVVEGLDVVELMVL